MTKLGRLVKARLIKNIEHIYLHALPVKEAEIIDFFLGAYVTSRSSLCDPPACTVWCVATKFPCLVQA